MPSLTTWLKPGANEIGLSSNPLIAFRFSSFCLLLTAHAHCLLPTAYYLLLTAHRLSHFKEINCIQLPGPADSSQDKHRSARVIRAQLSAIYRNVERQPVRVKLFTTKNASLPHLRLRPDSAPNKSGQFTRNDQRRYFGLPAAAKRRIELGDEILRGLVYRRCRVGRSFCANAGRAGVYRRSVFGIRADGVIEITRGLRGLATAQRNFAQADTRPRQGRGNRQALACQLPKFPLSLISLVLREQRAREDDARFLHPWGTGDLFARQRFSFGVFLRAKQTGRFTQRAGQFHYAGRHVVGIIRLGIELLRIDFHANNLRGIFESDLAKIVRRNCRLRSDLLTRVGRG